MKALEQVCFRAFFMPSCAGRTVSGSFLVSNIHQGIEKRGCLIQFRFLCPDTLCLFLQLSLIPI